MLLSLQLGKIQRWTTRFGGLVESGPTTENVMERKQLDQSQIMVLQQALQMKVRAHIEHAKVLEQGARAGGNPLMTPEACSGLALAHRQDAKEAQALGDLLDQASEVELRGEEFEESEDAED